MRPSILLLALSGLVSACDTGAIPTESSAPVATAAMGGLEPDELSPELMQDLARARASTARFHRFSAADGADYDLLFLGICMENQPTGGMGYHYVNVGLLDSIVEIEHPEALMYEPGPNGQRRLVGLEYVIPAAAWTSEDPPVLFGQELVLNDFDLWALHVWIWKNNPSGIFSDWNPTVNCANAAESVAARGSHH